MHLDNAKKLNKEIINNSAKPHDRDLARMRLYIIKRAKKRLRLKEKHG